MQRRIGEDPVKRDIGGILAGVHFKKLYSWVGSPCRLHHLGGSINANNLGSPGSDLGREMPRAAAKIENSLSRLWREEINERRSMAAHKAVRAVIESCIPLSHLTSSPNVSVWRQSNLPQVRGVAVNSEDGYASARTAQP